MIPITVIPKGMMSRAVTICGREYRPNQTAPGIALTIGLYPLGRSNTASNYPLGLRPWILAGLIPLFLGLSLILIHLLTKKGDTASAGE